MRIILMMVFWVMMFFPVAAQVHPADTSFSIADSTSIDTTRVVAVRDSILPLKVEDPLKEILATNTLLSAGGEPAIYPEQPRQAPKQEFDFYFLMALFAAVAILRAIYPRYFANMFRVFFNTSLRQGQLTDQLLQAKLPSLLFNLFFVITGGFYIYQMLKVTEMLPPGNHYRAFLLLVLALTVAYSGKFIFIKFAGWVSGFTQEADAYIFVVFLVNKILGLVLLPLVTIITFSGKQLSHAALVVSLIVVALLFFLRFFRSYGTLQHRLQLNRFHFFLYIISVEILPLLVLYRLGKGLFLNYS